MAEFDLAIPVILKHEGGYVNHPSDPGGATNRGIIFKLFKRYATLLGLEPTIDALKGLTELQAKQIYRLEFWDKMSGDQFKSQKVANIVFDGFVNMGNRALKMLQVEIGVSADGAIGPKTLETVNAGNETIIFQGYKDRRIKYYNDLVARKPELSVFLKGWMNRINSFQI